MMTASKDFPHVALAGKWRLGFGGEQEKKMKTALIITGGNIEEDFALSYLIGGTYEIRKSYEIGKPSGQDCPAAEWKWDYIIAADRGLVFLQRHGIRPSHIVGDFDSASENCLRQYENCPGIEIRKFKPEKDWTDTEIAAELALELGCGRIEILGGTGNRLDHVLGNLQVLALALERGADACLIDARNKVYLRDRPFEIRRSGQWGTYISFFAYGGVVEGLTLTGVKYPVKDFLLGCSGSRAVSNEITAQAAQISFTSGRLLTVEARD